MELAGECRIPAPAPPRAYTLTGEGQGRAAGFARMTARVAFAEDLGDILLRYDAQGEDGGKLASVACRIVQTVAKKNAGACGVVLGFVLGRL
jgi:carbon monoxide dehydrogenase subunit G